VFTDKQRATTDVRLKELAEQGCTVELRTELVLRDARGSVLATRAVTTTGFKVESCELLECATKAHGAMLAYWISRPVISP
jgi:hypothetical protein